MRWRVDRRRFLLVSAAMSLAPGRLVATAQPRSSIPPQPHMLQLNGYAANAETPLELLTDYLTPTELFFVRSHWIPRVPDKAKWRLAIDGDVERPISLSLRDLQSMPQTDASCVLQCAGNGRAFHSPAIPGVQWRYGAVGNARWRGVRLRDLLERAGVRPAAKHIHLFGSDDPPQKVPPFHRSLEIEKAMNDCILALEMNGAPLTAEHGAPARLVVPGWAGDHWMKWLVRISVQPNPIAGFYMDTAYRWPKQPGAPGVAFKPEEMDPVREMFVKSNITVAPRRARAGATYEIRGFAFSGAPDIEKVEISDDGGATWHLAALDDRHDPYAWRLWSFAWKPSRPGRATLVARATDVRGAVQPREAVWNQSGYFYNAWHSVDIEVTA